MPADAIAKHWLLNAAVEYRVWLGLIFPDVAGEALNMPAVPQFSAEDYARCLIGLFDSVLIRLSTIRASSEDPPVPVENRPDVLNILDQFLSLSKDDSSLRSEGHLLPHWRRARRSDVQVCFELTELGGETWEKAAEPDWDHVLFDLRDDVRGEVTSADRDLLMAWIGWYSQINGDKIRLDTLQWLTHRDFPILYWKRLPTVHQASFELEATEKQWPLREPQWFRDWWSITRRWHKKPWELPDWPGAVL